jgi:protein-disulfide isomerase
MSVAAGKAAIPILILLGFAATGSTCREQSGATKDPGNVPDVNLPEVDTSMLTPREKHDWSAAVTELLAPCPDVSVPIAQCVQEKKNCARCIPAAKFLVRQVRDGKSRDQMETGFHNRFDPAKVMNVEIGNAAARGSGSAPITLVEFADFECPVCGSYYPTLEKAFEAKKEKVRFVFKNLPLPKHTHAEPAARAGIAAQNQNKFWEMHHKLFENQEHLEASDLDRYAKDIGLDMTKFHADMTAKETDARLEADRKQADTLKVKGTPTIYINGREYDRSQEIGDWLTLELEMLGQNK